MTAAERFAELWTDFLEGDLDDADRAELDTLLGDPGLLREAVDSYRIHRLLGVLVADASAAGAFVTETMARLPAGADGFTRDVMQRVDAAATTPRVAPASGRGGWLSALAVALAGLFVVSGILAALEVVAPQRRVDPDPAALASVTQTLFPMVAYPGEPPVVGQKLGPGRLALQGGAVECTLRNGVVILLEGPCELELRDEFRAFLHGGSAVVRVPKGMSGFRLDTATTEVLDLGTEFAVKVGTGLVTDVQVFDGAVIASSRRDADKPWYPKRLESGEAARFAAGAADGPEPIPYKEGRFIRRIPAKPGREFDHLYKAPDQTVDRRRHFGEPKVESIAVERAIVAPAIDGQLDEWPATAGFACSRDGTAACPDQAEGWMMYDADHLYIAARVRDPEPMKSGIDPEIDGDLGWRGGGVQLRLSTDRRLGWPVEANSAKYFSLRGLVPAGDERPAAENPRLAHLTLWYHAASDTPCLSIDYGMRPAERVVNPRGYRGRFTLAPDSRGYTVEYAIPWRLLRCDDDPPQSDDALAAAWQVHFSDASGLVWRDQLIEVRNLAEPQRIYLWERAATWGRAEYR
jgi:hypothetical protein